MNLKWREWLWINLKIGALSFGGASRIMLYRYAVVDEKKWLDAEEFQEIFTLAQVLPGPNLLNLAAYLGFRLFGKLAAIIGIILLALPGALLIIAVSQLPLKNPIVKNLLDGFSLGSIILFVVFIFQLLKSIQSTSEKTLRPSKLATRLLIAVTVGIFSATGSPLIPLIIITIPICMAIEFGVPS